MSFSGMHIFTSSQLSRSWLGLEKSLKHYCEFWQSKRFSRFPSTLTEDLNSLDKFQQLLALSQSPYSRETFEPGHITGSAFIINKDATKVLLTHHKKLNKWLQLGGHSDGSSETQMVSYREAMEESGMKEVNLIELPGQREILKNSIIIPFDTDIHLIPARKSEPSHHHYDVRFLLVADEAQKVEISEESIDVKWFTIKEARTANPERSMQRQFDKLEILTH